MEEPKDSPICNSIDRISNLPENLIHQILSFMDMTYVVQTCVLSKRWKNLWTTTPVLNFDFNKFSLAINNNQNNGTLYRKFIRFVDQVFILRDSSNIQMVVLVCGKQKSFDISRMTACLTTWVVAAVRRNIQELHLDISGVKISRFPQCLFTCTSLIKLELKLGKYNSTIVVLPSSMDLPRLAYMKLDSLPSTDVNMTNRLFLECPVIESLTIEGRLGHMDLQISSLTLKHLTIIDLVSKTSSKVKIDAPNLVYFKCRDFISKWYVLENLASLVTADICMRATKDEADKMKDYSENHWLFLTALSNAKELRLSEWLLFLGFLAASGKNSLWFSNLQLINLTTYLPKHIIQALGWLLRISPNVESLSIVNSGKLPSSYIPDGEDYFVGVSLNHLRSVEIRGLLGHFNELKFVEIMFKKAVVLEKMLLISCKKSTTEKCLITFGEKLLTLPKASSNITTFLI